MFNSTHPLLGTYLKIFSRKTKKETKKGEHQAKKWGLMAKKSSVPGWKWKKFKNVISAEEAEGHPGKISTS